MDLSILPYLTGPLGALVVLLVIAIGFYTGKLHSDREFSKLEKENEELRTENDRLREALGTERRTSDELAKAGQVTNKVFEILAGLAMKRDTQATGDITPKELGL